MFSVNYILYALGRLTDTAENTEEFRCEKIFINLSSTFLIFKANISCDLCTRCGPKFHERF